MSEDRKRILGMLAEGKITADEGDMLLGSLGSSANTPATKADTTLPSASWPTGPGPAGTVPKFLYVKVYGGADTVDVKVPLGLLRAGLKLTSLIPPQAMDQINDSMGEAGMSFDFNNLKPEDVEALIENLGEMEVNVRAADGNNVRVFCA